jgi:anti-sigma regulatory factor (Ser/Thr protein kinase)
MTTQLQFSVAEMSAVAEARRVAAGLAEALKFGEGEAGKVSIVVTEAATNIVKHAAHGQLLIRPIERGGGGGLEVLALDQGPGMANVAECLRDGYSTAGSPGTGLGAIARLSAEFDIHSLPGKGTALVARLWARPLPRDAEAPVEVGAVSLPKPGEEQCGDAWAVTRQADSLRVTVADGLGHGPDAAAARSALEVAYQRPSLAPAALIEAMHSALRATRGAALGVAELSLTGAGATGGGAGGVRFAGVGNIAGAVLAPGGDRHFVSHSGIVGHEMRRVQEFIYPWPPGAPLVLHSDGLATRWDLAAYPGLINRDPSLIAGVLYRDFARGRDDVTVVVVKQG